MANLWASLALTVPHVAYEFSYAKLYIQTASKLDIWVDIFLVTQVFPRQSADLKPSEGQGDTYTDPAALKKRTTHAIFSLAAAPVSKGPLIFLTTLVLEHSKSMWAAAVIPWSTLTSRTSTLGSLSMLAKISAISRPGEANYHILKVCSSAVACFVVAEMKPGLCLWLLWWQELSYI